MSTDAGGGGDEMIGCSSSSAWAGEEMMATVDAPIERRRSLLSNWLGWWLDEHLAITKFLRRGV